MAFERIALAAAFVGAFYFAATARAADEKFIYGCDISMLPTIEKTGGVFSDNGKKGDAIQILASHGCNLFRVRIFVKPSTNVIKTYGAVQNLDYVRDLAKRIKASGQLFLLDIHYSDTWADPGKQYTPEEWKKLGFDDLKKKVHDYTVSVLTNLRDAGAMPDWVQVGNEITAGVLWPTGQVLNVPADQQAVQWQKFAELIDSGCKAVREMQTPEHPIRIVIHIHGGGREKMADYFFGKFHLDPADYDIVGMSFYPEFDDSIDFLKQNLADAIAKTGKPVVLAETSYPWKPVSDRDDLGTLKWPRTPEGQALYLRDLKAALRATPDGRAIGFIWWYPEAIPTPGYPDVWRGGYEALFDSAGNALPAAESYGVENGTGG
jgi:arabinogalactan endo-1,4-beta-galactosidase